MTARRYSQPFKWELRQSKSADTLKIELSGCLDESADLSGLAKEITGPVCFSAEKVQRVNSMGSGKWFRLLHEISDRGPHRIVKCAPSVVRALNMLPVLVQFCQVDSIMAGFACTECEYEREVELCSRNDEIQLPELTCSECDGTMELDESPSSYFRFMQFRKRSR